MSLWKIAWRSIQQRGVSSCLTALSMALGVALVVIVLVVLGVVDDSFRRSAEGYDILVGPKGSPLQLVLNTVYHLSSPIENIPYSYYREFLPGSQGPGGQPGKFSRDVAYAIPYCLGDNYEGFRVVGTSRDLFELFEYAPARHYSFADGRNFEADAFFEAVIGSLVANRTGLRVGDTFNPTHGISNDGSGQEHEAFTVVGILDPTGTPNDRALFVNMEGFYLLEGHAEDDPDPGYRPAAAGTEGEDAATEAAEDAEANAADADELAHGEAHASEHAHDEGHDAEHGAHHHEPLAEEFREVTAILVRSANPFSSLSLNSSINEGPVAMAVSPIKEVYKLFDGIVGNMRMLLLALAVMIVIVAGVGVMVGIYNSMNDRRREIAIMRSLGASRSTVLLVILLESVLLSLGGGLLGVVLGHALIGVLNPIVSYWTGISISAVEFMPIELALVPGLMLLATLAGFLPAVSAYRTDVAKALSASP